MKTIAVVLGLVVIIVVVIVVNAPPPHDNNLAGGPPIPIETVFAILEAENDAVRDLWTKEIVGEGQDRGLQFHEDWHDADVDAGPLPALFLRETAQRVQAGPTPLYLFLGSDFPINDANKFTDLQAQYFAEIKRTSMPQFFHDEEVGMHTAMFSDFAVAQTCIDCHNSEPESPKKDWQLGDIMGATTWSYPKAEVSLTEALTIISSLREGVRGTYEEYVRKTTTFADPPSIGETWPVDDYAIPTVDLFMAEAETRASANTLGMFLDLQRERNGDFPGQDTLGDH